MIQKSIEFLRSRRVVGFLWLLGGALLLISSVVSEGHETSVGAGIMFLILGIVFLSREHKS